MTRYEYTRLQQNTIHHLNMTKFLLLAATALSLATSSHAGGMVINGLTMPAFANNASLSTVNGSTLLILSNSTEGKECLEKCDTQMGEELTEDTADDEASEEAEDADESCDDECYAKFGVNASDIAVGGDAHKVDNTTTATVVMPGPDGAVNVGEVTGCTYYRRQLEMETETDDSMEDEANATITSGVTNVTKGTVVTKGNTTIVLPDKDGNVVVGDVGAGTTIF